MIVVSSDDPLAFQRIDDWVAPTWPGGAHPQQFHLDFSVGDIDAAEPQVLAIGARAGTNISPPRTAGSGCTWTRWGTPSASSADRKRAKPSCTDMPLSDRADQP